MSQWTTPIGADGLAVGDRYLLVVSAGWDGTPSAESPAFIELCVEDAALCVRVDAPFADDPAPTAAPGPTDRLWEHEVVELFLVGSAERYFELELGPHGHHLALQLAGVRRPCASGLSLSYAAAVERALGRFRGEARVPRSLLPPAVALANAYALHGVGAERSYRAAVPVPGPHPDFHRLHAFAALDAFRVTAQR